MSKRYAIVSIGTNSTRALLADVESDPPRIELARSIGTRLGEGLGEAGRLGDEPMRRTLDAVSQLARALRGHYVRLFAISTSAVRRAENGEEFAAEAQKRLNATLRVLSGEEEAAASYRGALTAFGKLGGEKVGVVDVGGGSTECAVGDSTEPERVLSCEIGAVRLTEAGADLKKARKLATDALKPLEELKPIERLASVGGSATTTAAILRGGKPFGLSHTVTREDLERVLEQLLASSVEQRKKIPGMRAQRADILPAGIIILEAALTALGQERAIVTTADLLLGVLLQERDAGQAARVHGAPPTRREMWG
ncbi:MAG: Ppx/GppA family phosphatase [Candidatus Eremiobacteraeota bacterium]|nr:Ppx/GppA family phosphatase [Candidatus Eremiobacteraeota bacterium]